MTFRKQESTEGFYWSVEGIIRKVKVIKMTSNNYQESIKTPRDRSWRVLSAKKRVTIIFVSILTDLQRSVTFSTNRQPLKNLAIKLQLYMAACRNTLRYLSRGEVTLNIYPFNKFKY